MDRLDIIRTSNGHVYTVECEWVDRVSLYSVISRIDGELHDTDWCEKDQIWVFARNVISSAIMETDDDLEQEST